MKKFLLSIILCGSFSFFANAATSCLDAFNDSWNVAWDVYDLDKYNCLVDPFSAPFNCEEDALNDRLNLENNAITSFDDCCSADPNC